MYRLVLTVVAALSLLATPALAASGPARMWVVSQLSGDARVVHSGLQPAALTVNVRLRPGDTVLTGATGRATLTRGSDYIVIAPRSELRLPSAPDPSGLTRVIETFGTMMFKVRHTGIPRFAVDTPMLAAVVKGTTFTVVVDQERSAVQVTEGVVEVSAVDGGMKRLVEGGLTVFLDHKNPKILLVAKSRPLGNKAPSSTNAVKIAASEGPSLATIANLTGGLVRAVATPPAQSAGTSPFVATATLASPLLATSNTTDPVADLLDATAPTATDPVTDIVDTTVLGATEPLVDVVDSTVDIVDMTGPIATEPVVELVDTTIPAVTEPVLEVVDTTAPAVIEPVVEVVDTTVPAVTEPVVEVVDTTVPAVTEPVVEVVDTTVPVVSEPVVEVVDTTVPPITVPPPGI